MTDQEQANVFTNYDISGCKVMSLDADKRRLIIDAALKEFAKGYGKANTAAIASRANISKGSLFHYFSSKKELYIFLIKYAMGVIMPEYEKAGRGMEGKDFLESLWQLTMVKMEMLKKHRELYEFMFSVLTSAQKDFPEEFQSLRNPAMEFMGRVYAKADTSVIRDDIDPDKAYKLIMWMLTGYSDEIIAEMRAGGTTSMEDMEPGFQRLIDEWEEYLAILRKLFYKDTAKV